MARPAPRRYGAFVLALLAALFGYRRIMGSDYGLVIRGISDNDRSVMSAGLNNLE